MGHYSHTCKLSGVPITGGEPVVLFPIISNKHRFDNSELALQKFGTTYQCSNDGLYLKFYPIWLPIMGTYDEYGGIENIIEDENTKILEEYYGLTIQQICAILTSGRKDDGYDDALSAIKVAPELPDDMVEGESWFERYQRIENDPMPFGNGMYPDVRGKKEGDYKGWTIIRDGKRIKATEEEYDADFKLVHAQYARYKEWLKENPDPTDPRGKDGRMQPTYQERYKELLPISGMWVHRGVYEKLVADPIGDSYSKIDLGNVGLLKALGFEQIEDDKNAERYQKQFTYKGVTVNSDGTWINLGKFNKYGVYRLQDLAKYFKEEHGIELEGWERFAKMDLFEQMVNTVFPHVESLYDSESLLRMVLSEDSTKVDKALSIMGVTESDGKEDAFSKVMEYKRNARPAELGTHMRLTILYKLLNADRFGNGEITNPMTEVYFQALKKGGTLIDNFRDFWRFSHYLYATGTYYAPVGTSPQDGEFEAVYKVLTAAKEVLEPKIKEIEDYRREEAGEES